MEPPMCASIALTNGTMFGPEKRGRERLRRLIAAGIDLIEFSMDAGDTETYQKLRPPIKNADKVDVVARWEGQVGNIRAALALRNELRQTARGGLDHPPEGD
jgi:hypothetical protein